MGEARRGITVRLVAPRKAVEPIDLDDSNPDAFSAPAIPTVSEPLTVPEIQEREREARQDERRKK